MAPERAGLLGWLALCYLAATIGGLASANAGEFYQQLVRPDWAPPGWVFGPVWSVLYTLMAVAAWLVWRGRGFAGAGPALSLFLAQLAVNAPWSWLFFAWHRGGLALADVLLLWLLLLATIIAFWRISRPAATLLLPYLAWVSFASVLNLSLWRLNPALLG